MFVFLLPVMKTRTVNVHAQKVNKHSYTKRFPWTWFDLLIRILRRFPLNPRTDWYVFILGGREFQTDDPENAKHIIIDQCECAVGRRLFFLLISSRRSVKEGAHILRHPAHVHFKHKHSCVLRKLLLQWKNF